jgi:ethanolamine ammonia-lyase small subunit
MNENNTTDDAWAFLREMTSARIALGRCGDGLPTARLLEFQLAHARARDAVNTPLNVEQLRLQLAHRNPVVVASQASTRHIYLQRPDLGRRLAQGSNEKLLPSAYDACIVLADGLSACALQSQGAGLYEEIIKISKLSFAPPVIASQARVALGDEIARATGARLVIMLIGERPGLSAADSLGAYITFDPLPGTTTDAQRNCISNIRPAGLSLEEAARRVCAIAALAWHIGCSGTMLKEDEALRALTYDEK